MAWGSPKQVPVEIIFDHEAFGEIVVKCEELVGEAKQTLNQIASERRKLELATVELNKVVNRAEVLKRRTKS